MRKTQWIPTGSDLGRGSVPLYSVPLNLTIEKNSITFYTGAIGVSGRIVGNLPVNGTSNTVQGGEE